MAFIVPTLQFARIGFFCSHAGSSMRGIVQACRTGELRADPALVVSNNPDSAAIAFAKENQIPALVANEKIFGSAADTESQILRELVARRVDLIVLSGYMKLLGRSIIEKYAGRIFNIHPALLPKYGGRGMYGMHVHRAVLAAGEKETGITIHEVNERYDEGAIIAQTPIAILDGDSPESLAERVKQREPQFLVETLRRMQSS